MSDHDIAPLPPQPQRGPKFSDVARRALELGPEDVLVQFATRQSVALKREMARLEADRLGERLEGLPRGEAAELVGARVGRSARTIHRWWANDSRDD